VKLTFQDLVWRLLDAGSSSDYKVIEIGDALDVEFWSPLMHNHQVWLDCIENFGDESLVTNEIKNVLQVFVQFQPVQQRLVTIKGYKGPTVASRFAHTGKI
jgi:hypothetical protein